MIGVAIALIVIGLIFGFVIPWVGIVVGIVGVLLFIAFVAGFGRRAASDEHRFEADAAARLAPLVVRFSLLNRRSGSGAAAGPRRSSGERRRPARSGASGARSSRRARSASATWAG